MLSAHNGNKSENMCFIDLFHIWNVLGQLTSFNRNKQGEKVKEESEVAGTLQAKSIS